MEIFHPHKETDPRSQLSVMRLVPAQDGGWSMTPMENLLRGLRGVGESVALELYGAGGVVNYNVRSNNGARLEGMLHSFFPQARVERRYWDVEADRLKLEAEDWMRLEEHEFALALPLSLDKPPFLPIMTWDDGALSASRSDPLAGVIGVLASATRSSVEGGGSDRLGMRLIVKPAPEEWGAHWQKRMQSRRDGDDRERSAAAAGGGSSSSNALLLAGGGMGGFALGNWWMYANQMWPEMALFNLGVAGLGGGGYWAYRKYFNKKKREYMDESLVEDKLKSLAFFGELQLVRIFGNMGDELAARESLDHLLDAVRQFDHPAGNSFRRGKLYRFEGEDLFQGKRRHPFLGGAMALDWLEPKRAAVSALSAREVASIWHPPLGVDEMATMERVAAGVLLADTTGLSGGGDDAGPLVGYSEGLHREIRLPEAAIRKHSIFVGKSGQGKSTLVKQVVADKLLRKARGLDDDAIVVIDPHADLVRDILKFVPPSVAHKVRLLDFGRNDRVPAINLLDPDLFPDRDRCVETIVNTVRYLWESWGNRLEDLLKRSLLMLYEYNAHEDTSRESFLTMLDILRLMEDGDEVGQGRNTKSEMNAFQRHVCERVSDPGLIRWFNSYLNWPRDTRAEAMGPVQSRIGAYQSNVRAKAVLGQRDSTIMLQDVLKEGQVLLVATAQGTIGAQPAALLGGTIVSLIDDAMRRQEELDRSERNRCLLICDEFQTVTGANWEGMLAEIRKYGGSLMLATQSLARLNNGERKLKEAVLGNAGFLVAYQMSAEDARIMAAEMDSERVSEQFLVNLNPFSCYVRINSDVKAYPTFSLRTLPPPDDVSGSDESVQAVVAGMPVYTHTWEKAIAMVNEMEQAAMDDLKIGLDGKTGPARGGGGRPGGGSGSALFDRVMSQQQAEAPDGAGGGKGPAEPKANGFDPPAAAEPTATAAAEPLPPGMGANAPGGGRPAERVQEGTLRGIHAAAVKDSKAAPEVLEEIVRSNPNDPGIREALLKLGRDQTARAERSGYARGLEQAREQVEREMEEKRAELEAREAELERQGEAARRTAALVEVADGLGGTRDPSQVVRPEAGGRRKRRR